MEILRKNASEHMRYDDSDIVPLLTFDALSELDLIKHGFTTRLGGVSTGIFKSLNFKKELGDTEENVSENYRRVAETFGITPDRFVLSQQTHTANVRKVTGSDAGKGVTRPRDYTDIDGLVTDVPGLMLSIFAADCVPVLFVDPVKKCIGACHSGWRGTVGRISSEVLSAMSSCYGSRPSDVICAIGPSICRDCYEVSDDVADRFKKEFPDHTGKILTDTHNGHFLLDLWAAVRITLEEAGVEPSHIHTTDICTCENPDLLFSHRASHGRRGVQGAFLMLER
jgi:hypothetical protein